MGRIVVPDLASAVASGQVPQLSCLANRSRNRCELVHMQQKPAEFSWVDNSVSDRGHWGISTKLEGNQQSLRSSLSET
jgi:hypothetical protein